MIPTIDCSMCAQQLSTPIFAKEDVEIKQLLYYFFLNNLAQLFKFYQV